MPKYIVDHSLPAPVTEKHRCIGLVPIGLPSLSTRKHSMLPLSPSNQTRHPHWPQWLSGSLSIRPNTAVDSPLPQGLLWKANTFYHCAMTKQACLDSCPENVGFFFFLLIHLYLSELLYLWLYNSYSILLTGSEFILYREAFPVCNLNSSMVSHNHSSWSVFVHIWTSTADKSHVSSSARDVSVSTCISVSKWILQRKCCLSLLCGCRSELKIRGIPGYNRKNASSNSCLL